MSKEQTKSLGLYAILRADHSQPFDRLVERVHTKEQARDLVRERNAREMESWLGEGHPLPPLWYTVYAGRGKFKYC